MKYFAFKAQAQDELSAEIRLEPETMSSSIISTVGTPDHTSPVVHPQAESAGGPVKALMEIKAYSMPKCY